MTSTGAEPGARLPDLGPRGIGWVVLQFVGLAWVLGSARWSGAWGAVLAGAAQISGLVLMVAAGVLLVLSFRALGKSLTALPAPLRSAVLVTSGPYERARHPIYGALVLACFGWALLWTTVPGLVAAAATTFVLALKSMKEEAWLIDRYPEYRAYRERTRRFLPLP